MVQIAVVGGNSGLALEVIEELVRDKKHDVLAICRKDPSQFIQRDTLTWVQVPDFQDRSRMVSLFQDIDVVLNFIADPTDSDGALGKTLADAAVEAGVKRYAPSEWATGQGVQGVIDRLPWYQGKTEVYKHLQAMNKDKKVLEYCLFQPGYILEYITHPVPTTRHMPTMWIPFQLSKSRIVAVKGSEDAPFVLTSVKDIARLVRLAIEDQRPWPEIGGFTGNRYTTRQLQEVATKVLGREISLELVRETDLASGELKVEMPEVVHASIPEAHRQAFHTKLWIGLLSGIAYGAINVTDEWNQRLPDFVPMKLEDHIQVLLK
ncbi:uncharacterized protein VDAG_09181 [Verticillium dahliae VdLs.17]|uniref:NmrA-like domain-containing protein n=1 Tax=Verticillium dahliae (strain VdLs.17 / ATCC MYA-4575 / FGSC 10137) TaxID=498257 RepID=G2XFQ7_VERDV|nr:uncharacterized protein VDAG_09181 [Verticillium dahliae VdLs.17]EGY18655.1 hypothetical protein VDAG_09181 [Verticillium dahliae VdLs.17]